MSAAPQSSSSSRKPSRARAVCRRVLLPLLAVLCLGVCWWSVLRLHPLQAETIDLSRQNTKLSAELDAMEAGIAQLGGAAQVQQRYAAGTNQLMAGTAGVERWLEQIAADGPPLALDIQVAFGTPVPQSWTNLRVSRLPATLSVRPSSGVVSDQTPYQRLLDLSHLVADSPKRVDLVGLDAQGQSNSVSAAELHLQLWVRDLP